MIDATELANELDFDLIAKHRLLERPHFLRRRFPNWELRTSSRREDGYLRDRLEIVTPKRTLWQEEVGPDVSVASAGIVKAARKHLLQECEDIEVFLEYLPPLDSEMIHLMHETAGRWRQVIGERGVLPRGPGVVCSIVQEEPTATTLIAVAVGNEAAIGAT